VPRELIAAEAPLAELLRDRAPLPGIEVRQMPRRPGGTGRILSGPPGGQQRPVVFAPVRRRDGLRGRRGRLRYIGQICCLACSEANL